MKHSLLSSFRCTSYLRVKHLPQSLCGHSLCLHRPAMLSRKVTSHLDHDKTLNQSPTSLHSGHYVSCSINPQHALLPQPPPLPSSSVSPAAVDFGSDPLLWGRDFPHTPHLQAVTMICSAGRQYVPRPHGALDPTRVGSRPSAVQITAVDEERERAESMEADAHVNVSLKTPTINPICSWIPVFEK